jgi:hypothetical protein
LQQCPYCAFILIASIGGSHSRNGTCFRKMWMSYKPMLKTSPTIFATMMVSIMGKPYEISVMEMEKNVIVRRKRKGRKKRNGIGISNESTSSPLVASKRMTVKELEEDKDDNIQHIVFIQSIRALNWHETNECILNSLTLSFEQHLPRMHWLP